MPAWRLLLGDLIRAFAAQVAVDSSNVFLSPSYSHMVPNQHAIEGLHNSVAGPHHPHDSADYDNMKGGTAYAHCWSA